MPCTYSKLIVPDEGPDPLFTQMQTSYAAAISEGTAANRLRQTRTYLTFMMGRLLDPYNPTIIHLLLYIQLLANSFKSVATVKNYVSGAKTFLTQHGVPTAVFNSPLINALFRGITRLSNHIPQPAMPIDINSIKRICDLLVALGRDAIIARAAILVGFATFLRQSNLLPVATPPYCGPHTVRRRDIYEEGGFLWVVVNSSKTIYDPTARVQIPILPITSPYCPVTAWRQMLDLCYLDPEAPAFMLAPDRPLTPQKLNSYLRATLGVVGFQDAHKVTVHSLRRSGAQECARRGVPQDQLMQHGTWSSMAINNYVPLKLYTKVPHTINFNYLCYFISRMYTFYCLLLNLSKPQWRLV